MFWFETRVSEFVFLTVRCDLWLNVEIHFSFRILLSEMYFRNARILLLCFTEMLFVAWNTVSKYGSIFLQSRRAKIYFQNTELYFFKIYSFIFLYWLISVTSYVPQLLIFTLYCGLSAIVNYYSSNVLWCF